MKTTINCSFIIIAYLIIFLSTATIGKEVKKSNDKEKVKQQFFYDKRGILTIDGSVPGQSDPITLDMKAKRFECSRRQYFVFTFCPDSRKLLKKASRCEEGISFCYDPTLTPELVREKYVLHTQEDLEVSKKCGENFRGFNVALKLMFNASNGDPRLFYEIQTGYQDQPFYFEKPAKHCITLWMGNEADLLTIVRTVDNEALLPVQVHSKRGGPKLGEKSEDYNATWLDSANMARFENQPSLKMLYLDMKSQEFVPQMMFTVGPNSECNLFARIISNDVGKCMSRFKQKAISIRPFGNLTTFKLTVVSGVDTNETQGTRTMQQKVLDKEFEDTNMEETEETETDEGIQTYDESVEAGDVKVLESTTKTTVEEKDVTSLEKKLAAAAINAASAAACGALSFFTAGFVSCSNTVEFKDIETTTFHESYTQSKVTNKKTSVSSNSVHSVQSVMQTAFTNSKGSSESTTHSEVQSMSNAVSKRTVFLWEIEIPAGKVMTPMQMSVDCDGNSVKIPWMKFKLVNDEDQLMEEYDPNDVPDADDDDDKKKPEEDDYELAKEISAQEKDAENAFAKQAEAVDPDENPDYSQWDAKNKDTPRVDEESTDIDYKDYAYGK